MKISDFQSGSFRTIVASKTYEGGIHLLRSHFGATKMIAYGNRGGERSCLCKRLYIVLHYESRLSKSFV